MTSELSNALNPNIVQSRSRPRNAYSPLTDHTCSPQHQNISPHVPHRSELELAISEPSYHQQQQLVPAQTASSTLEEILRILKDNKDDADQERERRMAWEREQEERISRQQSEMEQSLHNMKEELAILKASMPTTMPTLYASPVPSIHLPSPLPRELEIPVIAEHHLSPAPLTPVSQHTHHSQPTFIEGSSDHPLSSWTPSTPHSSTLLTPQMSHLSSAGPSSASVSPMLLPAPSPRNASLDRPAEGPFNPRKRHTPPSPSSDDASENGSDNALDANTAIPRKRLNGHDKRCLTIQHAIRAHFLRVMQIESDKELPESHVSGTPLGDGRPVRFVWEKTSKQSPHNATMKSRLLADLKVNRKRLYKYVPEKDFTDKTLDAAYDQAYTTLRQKFKAQNDERIAMNYRIKEEHKALKSRRSSRKKTKLSTRTEARKRLNAFAHPTFDGALQPECMSSEESCDEYSEPSQPSGTTASVQVLRIRGLPWRSSRLLRFYTHLDEDDKVDRSLKSKRIQYRNKERCVGPPKDGFHLPPKGIATWMVSQRWIRETRDAHPDLGELLKGLVVDSPGFDWEHFGLLGIDSDDELDSHGHEEIPRSEISYSLAHALAPM